MYTELWVVNEGPVIVIFVLSTKRYWRTSRSSRPLITMKRREKYSGSLDRKKASSLL